MNRDKSQEKLEFAKRFRQALEFRNHDEKSLAELKEIFDVSRTLIHQWKNGVSLPSIYSASLLSKALGVSYEWLLTGNGTIEGFLMQSAQEVTLIAQFRNLTKAGQLKLMTSAFDDCKAHEIEPATITAKQATLKLIKKKNKV